MILSTAINFMSHRFTFTLPKNASSIFLLGNNTVTVFNYGIHYTLFPPHLEMSSVQLFSMLLAFLGDHTV